MLPIRKVLVGVVASGVYFAMHKLGFAFTNGDANTVAQGLAGFVVAYLVPDPRVQSKLRRVGFVSKFQALNKLLETAATAPPQGPPVV